MLILLHMYLRHLVNEGVFLVDAVFELSIGC